MKRSTERILTTHVGNLHRPVEVQELFVDAQMGQPYDEDAYARELRTAVNGVVHKQADLGVDVVCDGEYSKASWIHYVVERMSGLELLPVDVGAASQSASDRMVRGSRDRAAFDAFYADAIATTFFLEPAEMRMFTLRTGMEVVCTGPIEYTGHHLVARDIANLKAGLAEVDVAEAFLPVVAPGSIQPSIRNEYYSDDVTLFDALATALRVEYKAIVDAGVICQIDDAYLPTEWDQRMNDPGWDLRAYREWAELAVHALNDAIAGLPEDRLRYHVCWGSGNFPHSTDIPLRDIVDLILKVNAQGYALEAANARHEFEYHVWEDVKLPEGKILIPGVIEHATNVVEHPETVADRILRFANVVGRENVIAGTDCGLRLRSHPQVAWAKLAALSEGARIASDRLWS